MTGDPKRLLGGYATDSLTEAERQALLKAALDDQKLFDALVEEEGLRELLADPAARQQVLEALERPTRWQRALAWLRRAATVGDLLVVAAALAVAVAALQVYRAASPSRSIPAATQPTTRALSQAVLHRLAALPPRAAAASAQLEFEGRPSGATPRVRSGEPLAIRVTLKTPGRVLLLETRPDGSVAQAWPAPPASPVLFTATPAATPVVRDVSRSASIVPGTSRLRLVVAPPDIDLAAMSPADLDRAAPRLALVDLSYETERP